MSADQLTEREESVLGAVIRAYVETAEPAGSRSVADRFALGISPATVRNTMAELEAKGYLLHPHTSAGRVPTDRAYRYFVDTLMGPVRLSAGEQRRLRRELGESDAAPPLERLIQRAAQVLGLLTGELGMALVPRLDEAVLEKLELVAASSEKVLLILTLRSGVVRMVYVDLPMSVPAEALIPVALVLNERLAGRTLKEIRRTLPDRLRDAAPGGDAAAVELLDIFAIAAEDLFDAPEIAGRDVVLGRASVLASQPEFASGTRLKSLIELTEERELLAEVLGARMHETPFTITIGGEHAQAVLNDFTLVTAEYRIGNLAGVLGVIGPTRMRYERVAALVDRSGALLTELLGEPAGTVKREPLERQA